MNDLKKQKEHMALASALVRMFDLWGLSIEDQSCLLGYDKCGIEIRRYREGEPLEDNAGLLTRVGLLLDIHKSLRSLYPRNNELAYQWVVFRNKAFGGSRPLDVMIAEGENGLRLVGRHLLERCNH